MIWYVARSGGLIAWALLALSVIWGLALSTKVTQGRPKPAWLLDLHRFLGATALVFTAIHVTSISLDTYVHFGPVNVLVPFTGSWHPDAVAWGILGVYALLAVEVTSLLRKRLPKNVWRKTHFLAFAAFGLTTLHAMTAGTDRHTAAMQLAVVTTSALIAGLTALRIYQATTKAPRPAMAAATTRRGTAPRPVSARYAATPPGADRRPAARPLVGAGRQPR